MDGIAHILAIGAGIAAFAAAGGTATWMAVKKGPKSEKDAKAEWRKKKDREEEECLSSEVESNMGKSPMNHIEHMAMSGQCEKIDNMDTLDCIILLMPEDMRIIAEIDDIKWRKGYDHVAVAVGLKYKENIQFNRWGWKIATIQRIAIETTGRPLDKEYGAAAFDFMRTTPVFFGENGSVRGITFLSGIEQEDRPNGRIPIESGLLGSRNFMITEAAWAAQRMAEKSFPDGTDRMNQILFFQRR